MVATPSRPTTPVPIPLFLTVTADAAEVIVGGSIRFVVTSNQSTAPSGGSWSLDGGAAYGAIDQDGTYHAPALLPSPNTVAVHYMLGSVSATGSTTVLNPAVQIMSAVPAQIGLQTAQVTLAGSGFLPNSSFTLNGKPVTAT